MQFSYNYYRIHDILLIRVDDGYRAYFIISCESITQGDPLATILYGISILLLTLDLKIKVHMALQPWYADTTTAGSTFDAIDNVFNLIISNRLAR